jgi:hypothetical protein
VYPVVDSKAEFTYNKGNPGMAIEAAATVTQIGMCSTATNISLSQFELTSTLSNSFIISASLDSAGFGVAGTDPVGSCDSQQ